MFIKKLKIMNYKGFRDSGWMEFGPGFNVIVGQNNSGKTAVLENFRLNNCEDKPHRTPKIPRGVHVPYSSSSIVSICISGAELSDAIQRTQQNYYFSSSSLGDQVVVDKVFGDVQHEVELDIHPGSPFIQRREINYQTDLEHLPTGFLVGRGPLESTVSISQHRISGGSRDDIPRIVWEGFQTRFYVFRAERLNVGSYQISDESLLNPNASNLPAVLTNLFSSNPTKTKEYNANVKSVFPTINHVLVRNIGNTYRIFLWTHEADSDRDDLAIALEDSGAGVGQVLAILYVAMMMPPSVIAIDEPNSFLHPGAAKKLLQILSRYRHQYVVSTHSADIITAVEPDTLHLVTWADGESSVTTMRRNEIQDMRLVLNEVGVGLSDVFALDRVIWVEGQTEQECFPKLYRHCLKHVPLGLSFLAVHSTGDFDARDWTARKIWKLYQRLTDSNGIMPVAIAFSLDRENRTENIIRDMKRETGGKMHFLPRRCYENFLLQPEAIAEVLNRNIIDVPRVSIQSIEEWLSEERKGNDENWIETCDAAKLLSRLFSELSIQTVKYDKTKHSTEITEWLLENRPEALSKLIAYVVSLVPASQRQ